MIAVHFRLMIVFLLWALVFAYYANTIKNPDPDDSPARQITRLDLSIKCSLITIALLFAATIAGVL